MGSIKCKFTLPEGTARKLTELVADRKRSAFVAAAIDDKLRQLEMERLDEALIEGYKASCEEDAELNKEWEAATLEGWA